MCAKKLNINKTTPKKASKNKPVAEKKRRTVKQHSEPEQKDNRNIKSFPVVGVGGSAGGLEAFSNLLQHLSPALGMAYVYIQHLSPDHESLLPQILQRKTKMPVLEVKDNLPLKKDHVYVIPS